MADEQGRREPRRDGKGRRAGGKPSGRRDDTGSGRQDRSQRRRGDSSAGQAQSRGRSGPKPPSGPRPQGARRTPYPRRPDLPDERPFIDAEAWRDIRGATGPGAVEDVAKAFGAAGEALVSGDEARALELLEWAKAVAPRSSVIREALGVLHYGQGDLRAAQSELQAYRRLSGRADQNHLLADAARAAGRREKVVEYVDEMIRAGVKADRAAEGILVLAGDRADHGDLDGALETLKRANLEPNRVQAWHLRLWYMAGDLSERLGDRDEARDYFEAIVAIDEDFGDAADRLAALDPDAL